MSCFDIFDNERKLINNDDLKPSWEELEHHWKAEYGYYGYSELYHLKSFLDIQICFNTIYNCFDITGCLERLPKLATVCEPFQPRAKLFYWYVINRKNPQPKENPLNVEEKNAIIKEISIFMRDAMGNQAGFMDIYDVLSVLPFDFKGVIKPSLDHLEAWIEEGKNLKKFCQETYKKKNPIKRLIPSGKK